MNNDTVETSRAIFRWSERSRSLIVTTATQQIEMQPGDVMALLELLYQNKQALFKASQGLPDWLQDDEPQPGPRPLPVPTVDANATNAWLDERSY